MYFTSPQEKNSEVSALENEGVREWVPPLPTQQSGNLSRKAQTVFQSDGVPPHFSHHDLFNPNDEDDGWKQEPPAKYRIYSSHT
jgi:hypothetical protein